MNSSKLQFRPSEHYVHPDGRSFRFWGKLTMWENRESFTAYVFFDIRTGECVELKAAEAMRLKHVK